MTEKELKEVLEKSGYPVFYDHAKKGTEIPFITFTTSTDNFFADNKSYSKLTGFEAKLYTSRINDDTSALEHILDEAEIPYNRDETYMEDSDVYIEIYESEAI